ncbi:TPA: hypothetical protein U8203_002401 [Pseudomonas putida]|jgi:hypothetical protein|nr:hypothetical protein [Pseudomonas putida]HEN8717102.1 hypothetical protein [Pseudomonas putida]
MTLISLSSAFQEVQVCKHPRIPWPPWFTSVPRNHSCRSNPCSPTTQNSKAAARIERTTLMNRIQPVAVFAICVHPISQILLFARQKIV